MKLQQCCLVMTSFLSLHSDITVSFADQKIKAHKFVLAARGDHWSSRDLNEISELQLAGMETFKECHSLLKHSLKQ